MEIEVIILLQGSVMPLSPLCYNMKENSRKHQLVESKLMLFPYSSVNIGKDIKEKYSGQLCSSNCSAYYT